MNLNFDPKMSDFFRNTSRDEWEFSNDASGGDMRIMRYNDNPHSSLEDLPGFNLLEKFVQDKLKKTQTYSLSEVQGWTRVEFQNQRLIDMYGNDVIYVPPEDKDSLFFKAMEQWFDGLPYKPDQFDQGMDELTDTFNLTETKDYGLTSSLLDIFGDK